MPVFIVFEATHIFLVFLTESFRLKPVRRHIINEAVDEGRKHLHFCTYSEGEHLAYAYS